ncbi:MAG: coproporphyrinogen III oxidase [Rhodobacterales bacterium 12-64-8]|nr:MAG: coproporphyrinogen III oxidase [Rhodobacterales bacterium 12-64-8]
MSEFDPQRGFGVYVHWPYCARICPYCDFNVYAAKARDTAPLFDAILRDLEGWRARTGEREVTSIFLGGGTPSLMTGEQVSQLIAHIGSLWRVAPEAEITLEANPDDHARFGAFAEAGVNRLSLGVQSLDDERLKFLGRTHSAGQALEALEAARGKFRSVSIDMIYAVPGQSLEDWRGELSRALALGADHLSLYELSIEPGAAFFQAVKRKSWSPASDDEAAELFDVTQAMTEAAGLPAYEISNHARGAEHRSVHNGIYWKCGDWVGVGPGAHGRLTIGAKRWAVEAAEKPGAYLHHLKSNGIGWGVVDELDAVGQARERVAMGLRVVEGFAVSDVEALRLKLNAENVTMLVALGFLVVRDGRVVLTPEGLLRADRIAAEIAP